MSLLEKILHSRKHFPKSDYEDLTSVEPNSMVNSNNTFINVQFNLVVTLVVFSSIIMLCLLGFLVCIFLPKKMVHKNCRKLRRDNTIYDFHSVNVQPQIQLTRPLPPPVPANLPRRINNRHHQQASGPQQQATEHQQEFRHIQSQNDQNSINPSVITLDD